jgi:purine-binding chemotaxis protein CheW
LIKLLEIIINYRFNREEQGMAETIETTQYLTFNLADEIFAVDVGRVREILEITSITKVPQTPDFMRGVINLRGSVVPVIDMRLKFGMTETERTVNTCIIVVEVTMDGETIVLGSLADSVQEVIEMEPDHIEEAPHIGTHLNTEFIRGMGKHDGRFVMILDIDKIFSEQELDSVIGKKSA